MTHNRAEIIFDMARERVCAMDTKIALIRAACQPLRKNCWQSWKNANMN